MEAKTLNLASSEDFLLRPRLVPAARSIAVTCAARISRQIQSASGISARRGLRRLGSGIGGWMLAHGSSGVRGTPDQDGNKENEQKEDTG